MFHFKNFHCQFSEVTNQTTVTKRQFRLSNRFNCKLTINPITNFLANHTWNSFFFFTNIQLLIRYMSTCLTSEPLSNTYRMLISLIGTQKRIHTGCVTFQFRALISTIIKRNAGTFLLYFFEFIVHGGGMLPFYCFLTHFLSGPIAFFFLFVIANRLLELFFEKVFNYQLLEIFVNYFI